MMTNTISMFSNVQHNADLKLYLFPVSNFVGIKTVVEPAKFFLI